MARTVELQKFYASKVWHDFRLSVIAERGMRCEYCGERIATASELTLHHKEPLTPVNMDDAMVALNPDNVMLVHRQCHNTIHHGAKSEYSHRGVYIVYGPPLSGKSSHVSANSTYGDLIVDYDLLFEAVSGMPRYVKPNELLPNVNAIRALMLDQIKTRYGKWLNAWVIGGFSDKYKRDKLAQDLGAELIFINTDKSTCLERLKLDPLRRDRYAEWKKYIEEWFLDYTEW